MPKPDSMRCDRKDFDYDINELYGFAIEHLPPDWRISIQIRDGEMSMALENFEDDNQYVEHGDGDHIDHWLELINYARKADGMDEVSWDEHEQYS